MEEKNNNPEIKRTIKTYMNSEEFKTRIANIVKEKLKNNKEIEDKQVEITRNVLTQLFKTLWMKRSTWKNNLTNKNS